MRDASVRTAEAQRRFNYMLVLVLLLPRMMFNTTVNDGAIVMLVWSAVGLALTRTPARIPRAIVWRRHDFRIRRWAARLLEHVGRQPITYGGWRSAIVWHPVLVRLPHPADTTPSRDLIGDLAAPNARKGHG